MYRREGGEIGGEEPKLRSKEIEGSGEREKKGVKKSERGEKDEREE